MLKNAEQSVQSQKVTINDSEFVLEHTPFESSCCFLRPNQRIDRIRLVDIHILWQGSIPYIGPVFALKSDRPGFGVIGLRPENNTPILMKEYIIKNRTRKKQLKPMEIPSLISTYKEATVSLNPTTSTLELRDEKAKTNIVVFIDKIGSIDEKGSSLHFYSPPVGRPRGGSQDAPEMIVYFHSAEELQQFKQAVEASRDSYILYNTIPLHTGDYSY